MRATLLGIGLVMLMALPAQAQTVDSSVGRIAATTVVDGLDHPWSISFLPDGRLIVTERSGHIRIVSKNGTLGEPISGMPEIETGGQAGLFDLVLAPDFAQSGRVYFAYSGRSASGAALTVNSATLTVKGDSGALSDQKVLVQVQRGGGLQYGGRIAIAADGNLLITSGDHGERDRAQDFADLAGGMIRIGPDGSVPADNPKPAGWAPELLAKGERNAQGLAIRPGDGAILTVEHGAKGGDELNRIEPGKNYGWPVITYGINYDGQKIGEGTEKAGLEQPLHYWDPSIAPSGLVVYEGALFPAWQGDVVLGALKFQMLVHLKMDGDTVVSEERLFEGQLGRIRDVRIGPDGALYLATDEDNGRILRVAPAQ
ncbi:MAG: PQQ-dependent sugar dehydrogenase [Devosia sp.]